jgi:carbohydrate binding protein with CBM4/9 domain
MINISINQLLNTTLLPLKTGLYFAEKVSLIVLVMTMFYPSVYADIWDEPVQNTDFEESSLTWWVAIPKTPPAGTIAIDTSEYHSGSKSIKIDDTSSVDKPCFQSPLMAIDSSKKYTHSWWVKGGVLPTTVHIYYDSSSHEITTGYPIVSLTNATDWTNGSKTFGPSGSGADYVIPSNAAYIKLRYYASPTSADVCSANFDDITFSPAYSECVDAPVGPSSVSAPGGEGLPPIWNEQTLGSQAISAISDVTLPDETLVITGNALADTSFKIWAENYKSTCQLLKGENNRVLAVIPDDAPISTMLIWPVKAGTIGSPIRVNGAAAWWAWPGRAKANMSGQTVRVIGKNLKIGTATPVMYLKKTDNSIIQLTIVDSNEYQLEASLPGDLAVGTYTIWAHNGTGGKYGWSQPLTFEVAQFPVLSGLPTFLVDNYGAVANDGLDDLQAINSAITAAKNAGGGIVTFTAGEYNISQQIVINGNTTNGIHLKGVGMGTYDNVGLLNTVPDVYNHGVGGTYTLIRYVTVNATLSLNGLLSNIIQIDSNNTSIEYMTLINADYGRQQDGAPQWVMTVNGQDARIQNVRMISVDARNYTATSVTVDLINLGVIYLGATGDANIVIKNCHIHSPKKGMCVGNKLVMESVNYAQVKACSFWGYYAGKHPRDSRAVLSDQHGLMANAITAYNAKNLILEDCYFASGDRLNGKILNRSFLAFNNSNRNMYIANNTIRNVGPHPSVPSMAGNCGEQFLLHESYVDASGNVVYGGLFDVTAAGENSVTLNTANIPALPPGVDISSILDNTGSQIRDEIAYDQEWIVYVCAGKGVGQYRVLDSRTSSVLSITEPWRVIPDSTSRVMIEVVYRHNIIYNNDIQNYIFLSQSGYKSVGVLLFYRAFENIISDNTFKNLSVGVAINEGFRWPVCWNLTRRNTMDTISGLDNQGGDSSSKPSFYSEVFRNKIAYASSDGWSEELVWFSVGNIARQNTCTNGLVAAYFDSRQGDKNNVLGYYDWEINADRGIMMSVLENNTLSNTDIGINIGKPAIWTLVRNNVVTALPFMNFDVGQYDDIDDMEILTIND